MVKYLSGVVLLSLFCVCPILAEEKETLSDDEIIFKEIGLETTFPKLIRFVEGRSELIESLVKQLDDEEWRKRESAQEILISIGMPVLARLQSATKDPAPEVRMRANFIIKEIVPANNWRYLSSAVRLLAKTKDKKIIPPLLGLLDHPSREIAYQSASVLVPFNKESAIQKALTEYQKSAEAAEAKKDIYGVLKSLEKILWLNPDNEEVKKKIESLCQETLCIIYLVDESGSMNVNKKIEAVKQGLLVALDKLPAGASFNVIFYATQPYPYKDGVQILTPSIKEEVKQFINQREARGGANYLEAFEETFRQIKARGKTTAIFFITDGPPTVPSSGLDYNKLLEQFVREADSSQAGKTRIFALGLGNESDPNFLNNLASRTNGASHIINATATIEGIAKRIDTINTRIIETLMGPK